MQAAGQTATIHQHNHDEAMLLHPSWLYRLLIAHTFYETTFLCTLLYKCVKLKFGMWPPGANSTVNLVPFGQDITQLQIGDFVFDSVHLRTPHFLEAHYTLLCVLICSNYNHSNKTHIFTTLLIDHSWNHVEFFSFRWKNLKISSCYYWND